MRWNQVNHVIFTLFTLSILIFSFFPFTSFAWNTLGHKVVATIAYQNLKPAVQKKVDVIVSYFSNDYLEMKTFLDLSYWPDAIRSQKINTYTHWHFIDTPFTKDKSPLVNTIKEQNVVWAIENVRTVVKNFHANPSERVRFLSFLIHFVSDIHQPLHASTCISAKHPSGDKGGNLYYVYVNTRRVNLHELWDSGLGSFDSDATPHNADVIAKRIMALHPKNEFGNRIFNLEPNEWSKESFNHAKDYVYTVPEEQKVDANYIAVGKQHAEELAALAGYRLAEMLNSLLS